MVRERPRGWLVLAIAIGVLALPTSASAAVTTLESPAFDGSDGFGDSDSTAISRGGDYVVFVSDAADLVGGPPEYGTFDVFFRDIATGATEQISVDSAEQPAMSFSTFPDVSADGRYVTFSSAASNLAPNSNGQYQIYLRDRVAGTTTRVSSDRDDATLPGDGVGSSIASISADGNFVAYTSGSSNLVAGDSEGKADIFVWERASGNTERITFDAAFPSFGGNGHSYAPTISADGRYVAFLSDAYTLVADDTNNFTDVFVYDRNTATAERVSVSSSEQEGDNGSGTTSSPPAITPDGRFVAFESYASNLVGADTNGTSDVFVRDVTAGTTERVSVSGSGAQGNDLSGGPSISDNGEAVSFTSAASNLISGDGDGVDDVFLRDRAAGTTQRVSVSVSGGDPEGFSDFVSGATFDGSYFSSISGDGSLVAFSSDAHNLTSDSIVDGGYDLFVTDRNATPPPPDGGGDGGTGGGDGGTGGGDGGTGGGGGGTGGGGGGTGTGGGGGGGTGGGGGGVDRSPPEVVPFAKAAQKLAKKLKVEVGCDEDCSVVVAGKLQAGKGKKGRSALSPANAEIGAGESVVLKPKLSRRGLKAAAKAIKRGKPVTAKLTIEAVDATGNDTRGNLKVKLTGK